MDDEKSHAAVILATFFFVDEGWHLLGPKRSFGGIIGAELVSEFESEVDILHAAFREVNCLRHPPPIFIDILRSMFVEIIDDVMHILNFLSLRIVIAGKSWDGICLAVELVERLHPLVKSGVIVIF